MKKFYYGILTILAIVLTLTISCTQEEVAGEDQGVELVTQIDDATKGQEQYNCNGIDNQGNPWNIYYSADTGQHYFNIMGVTTSITPRVAGRFCKNIQQITDEDIEAYRQ